MLVLRILKEYSAALYLMHFTALADQYSALYNGVSFMLSNEMGMEGGGKGYLNGCRIKKIYIYI
jgi:hypothetical protein